MNIKIKIGNRIREERENKGLTRKSLGELTDDLNISRINNYERGERTPGPEEIKQLAKALDVSPAYLMCLTDSKHPYHLYQGPVGALIPLLDHQQACDPVPFVQAIKNERFGESLFIPISNELAECLGENAFALRMKDESMEPELKINDILIIDPSQEPNPGGFVVAQLEDSQAVIVRRYKQLSAKKNHEYELAAINDAWANICVDSGVKSNLIGPVINLSRRLKL